MSATSAARVGNQHAVEGSTAAPARKPPHVSKAATRWVPWIALALFTFTSIACQNGQAGDESGSAPRDTEAAAADSSLVASADSTGADSTAAPAKSSWKDRFFGGGSKDGDESAEDDEDGKDPPVPVELAAVEMRDMPAFLTSTATLEPEKSADVLAKTRGQIQKIHVEEGDWVRTGQLLAELDGAEQRAALNEAAARARGLKADLDRLQALFEQQLAAEKDLNKAQTDWEQADAARQAVELDVAYTRITAPYDGQISRRQVDRGQTVSDGTHLFTIADADPLLALVYLPEREVARLEPGQEVVVTSDANEALRLTGTVLRIAPIVDTRTGTVKVTCQVRSDDEAMRPGSFVRVQVQTGLHEGVRSIPKRALVAEGSESYVYRAEADSVLKVRVSTGFSDESFIEVVEGLEIGDRVVSVGHGGLKEGTKIRDLSERETSSVESSDTASRL